MQFLASALPQRLVEAHHQRVLVAQVHQVLHVDHGRVRSKTLAVTCREAFREVGQHLGAIGLTEALDHQAGVVVLPAAAGLDDFFFQQQRIDIDAVFGSTRRISCTRASTDSEKKVQNSQSEACRRSISTCWIFCRTSVE